MNINIWYIGRFPELTLAAHQVHGQRKLSMMSCQAQRTSMPGPRVKLHQDLHVPEEFVLASVPDIIKSTDYTCGFPTIKCMTWKRSIANVLYSIGSSDYTATYCLNLLNLLMQCMTEIRKVKIYLFTKKSHNHIKYCRKLQWLRMRGTPLWERKSLGGRFWLLYVLDSSSEYPACSESPHLEGIPSLRLQNSHGQWWRSQEGGDWEEQPV